MGDCNDRSIDERIGHIESDLDDIRLALWKISETLDHIGSGQTTSPENRQAAPDPSPARAQEPPQQAQPSPRIEPQPPQPTPRQSPRELAKTRRDEQRDSMRQKREEMKAHARRNIAAAQAVTSGRQGGPPTPSTPVLRMPPVFFKAQFWFTLIGVLLVVLGVIYLYRYSVEQGWITSPMKVAFGLALGALLLIPGILLHGRQRFLSQMLMAAAVITFYLSGYAAFQLYELIPLPVAIAWMGAVTLASFVLSVQQNEQALSFTATLGGLVTPLMLHQGISSKMDVVLFVCAVLLGAGAIYLLKGWRLLLWTSFTGGWLSLAFVHNLSLRVDADVADRDKIAMQAAVAFALLLFWLLPLVREALAVRNPGRWAPPPLTEKEEYKGVVSLINRHVYALSVTNPFIALSFTRQIWHLENTDWGWVVLGTAALFGLSFVYLWGFKGLRKLAYVQALLDLSLLTMALGLILDGDARFIALTAETLALHLVAWKLKDRIILIIAHGFSFSVSLLLIQRLIDNNTIGTAIFNAAALSELAFIVALAAVSFIIYRREVRYGYQLFSYLAIMAWFLRELSSLTNGQALVTVAWGLGALVLLAAGIALRDSNWRRVALVTLFVVVAKLLLVDLAAVKAIWRVLLLVGFGTLFLVLSYFFQSLWRPEQEPETNKPG